MISFKELFAVFVGGGVGSVLRYSVQMLMHQKITAYNFPLATLSVNILGSFMIGLFYALSARFNLSAEVRLLLTAGLCGGFTTFSTFSNDTLELLRQGSVLAAVLYILVSVIIGVGACFAGAGVGSVAFNRV